MRRFLPLVSCLVALAASPAVAAPLATTAAEEVKLAAREVIIRELPTAADGAVRVVAAVDIQASIDAVWSALLDFDARKRANAAVQAVDDYKPRAADAYHIRWHIAKFGMDIVYHNRYLIDRSAGRLVHTLDPAEKNDLTESRGVYEVYPSPAGGGLTRLVWDVESNFGRAIPTFVQKWMSTGATRDFMADMARRAEVRAQK